jgi:predicted CXXCH cytochrome family protein
MATERTNKIISARIDPEYYRRRNPLRKLILAATLIGIMSVGGWMATAGVKPNALVHNPGELTANHVMWSNDCTACHAATGISLATTAESCMACHHAAPHHENQKDLVHRDASGAAVASTNCSQCHVEHRGQALLIGTNDGLCTSCHTDVKAHALDPAKVASAVTAVAFNGTPEGHPQFGSHLRLASDRQVSVVVEKKPVTRDLKAGDLFDPTRLRFNHSHPAHKVTADNCVTCHSTLQPPATVSPAAAAKVPGFVNEALQDRVWGKPATQPSDDKPWARPGDRPAKWLAQSDFRAMQPVNFEAHCAGCHTINAYPGGPVIPHEELAVVRQYIANLDRVLVAEGKAADLAAANAQLKGKMSAAFLAQVTKIPQLKGIKREEIVPNAVGWSPFAFEMNTVYGSSNGSCVYCHEVQTKPTPASALIPAAAPAAPAGPAATRPAAAAAPATRPAGTTIEYPVRTLATGIPDAPRVWFPNSQFDHHAHRGLSCVSCHADALKSQFTSDVLMPKMVDCVACHHNGDVSLAVRTEIGERQNRFLGTIKDSRAAASTQSADGAAAPASGAGGATDAASLAVVSDVAAPSNCVTCHVYHDRRHMPRPDANVQGAPAVAYDTFKAMIRAAKPQPAAPATQPAVAAH